MARRGSLPALLDLYLSHLKGRRCSEATLSAARCHLPRFFIHLEQRRVRDVRAATEEHVVSYVRSLLQAKTRRGKPLSPWTRQSYLVPVRGFFAFLRAQGVILRDPAREVALPRFEALPPAVMSISQAQRLMSAPEPATLAGLRDRALLEVLYGTGLRLSECVRCDLTDLDLLGRRLFVRDGKGRRDRLVPLGACAARALDRYLRASRPALIGGSDEGALFLARQGRRLSRISVEMRVRGYGRRLGLRVSPHALRHACATHLLRGGASVRHVQQLLGHRSIRTTARYTRVEVSDLAAVLERSHPRERRGATRTAPS